MVVMVAGPHGRRADIVCRIELTLVRRVNGRDVMEAEEKQPSGAAAGLDEHFVAISRSRHAGSAVQHISTIVATSGKNPYSPLLFFAVGAHSSLSCLIFTMVSQGNILCGNLVFSEERTDLRLSRLMLHSGMLKPPAD